MGDPSPQFFGGRTARIRDQGAASDPERLAQQIKLSGLAKQSSRYGDPGRLPESTHKRGDCRQDNDWSRPVWLGLTSVSCQLPVDIQMS